MTGKLKNLFDTLLTATGKYDDLARKLIGNADDVARASGNVIGLDDLMQFGNASAKAPIEPITIGNYIKPDHSFLSLDDVRKMDAGQSGNITALTDAGAGFNGFKDRYQYAAPTAKHRDLDEWFDSWHKQRLYDSAISHGAIPSKLDSFLKRGR